STDGVILDTSFALLFLTLATGKLGAKEKEEVKRGPGWLTVHSSGVGGSVLFILDASGSMGAPMGKETRLDVARRVVLRVLAESGKGLDVALRVYGHRYTAIHKQANQDSELLVGFGPADRPELEAKLAKLRCRGKTPLTYSLKQSLEDLQSAEGEKRRVVLLTDGLESDRRAKPVEAAAALERAGARLDVVSLAMASAPLLERMAEAGGGSYYSAADAGELLRAFKAALLGEVGFRVLDRGGKEVARGKSGEKVKLPAGPYVVEIDLPEGASRTEAWVNQDRTTTITVGAQK
ncbi:MAG: VWA domain-containing protein, partial [Planctomycetota bacterium]